MKLSTSLLGLAALLAMSLLSNQFHQFSMLVFGFVVLASLVHRRAAASVHIMSDSRFPLPPSVWKHVN